MATEIYLQPELEELVLDVDKRQEWEKQVNELGLEGQLELTKHSDKNSPSPYTPMNQQMMLVYKTICPARVAVERYNKAAIPIDVLSHIALCKQERYFKKLEIWYDDRNPDPLLVGFIKESYSDNENIIHLIARWGDEIVPYELLVEKAIKRYTENFIAAVQETKSQCEDCLTNAQSYVKQIFAGQKRIWNIQPHFQHPTS